VKNDAIRANASQCGHWETPPTPDQVIFSERKRGCRLILLPKGDFWHLSAISNILQISALGDKVDARRVHHEHPIIAFASATSGAFEVPT
jgi:hypothetical protein